MTRGWSIAAVVIAVGAQVPTGVAAPRPKPDAAAIRDAIGDGEPTEHYVSARALTHYVRAVMARTQGDAASEIAELRLAALYDAENPWAQYELAREYLQQGDLKAARAAAGEALALDPNHAPTLALLGRVELRAGNAERAASTLKRAVALLPAEAEPTTLLIDALLTMGSPAAAATAADRLSRMTADNAADPVKETVAGALGRVAEALARDGRSDQAEHFYVRAAQLEPTKVGRQVALARFYERRDRAADAADCYARAVGLAADRVPFVLDAARLYLKADKPQRAAGYVPLLAGETNGSAPLLRLGQLLEEGGAKEEAIRAYQASAQATAGWGEPLMRAGRLLVGLGREGEAAACYRAVPVADDQHDEAEARAELCELKAASPRKPEHDLVGRLRALVQKTPSIPEAFDLLSKLLVGKREWLPEAEEVARAALARWPERAESLQVFGRVLLAQGKREAFDVLEKAAGLLPARPEPQLDLAEAALVAGHPDAATAALNRARSLLPSLVPAEVKQRLGHLAALLAKSEARPDKRTGLRASGKR